MLFARFAAMTVACVLAQSGSTSQQPVASQGDTRTAGDLLQRSRASLVGSIAVSDVTLSGTVRRIAGSDDEIGTAVLKALAAGASRVDLTLPSGQRSETYDLSATSPAGAWSGPDHISHPIPFHNLFTESAWFFPAIAVARRLSASGYVATYVGREARNGRTVEHISVSQSLPFSTFLSGVSLERLTQVDFFLDSNTLLPAVILFDTHSDTNLLVDIPIEIRFSDYRLVNGAQVPFHIQKFLNNGLILDLQLQTATMNTGLSSTDFQVQ